MFLLYVMSFMSFSCAISSSFDEFRSVNQAELPYVNDDFIRQIMPSGYSPHSQRRKKHHENLNENDTYFQEFYKFIENGVAAKGRTFNIYNDGMRNATIALFRLFQNSEHEDYLKLYDWAKDYVNHDVLRYAKKANYLYSDKLNRHKLAQTPCYTEKPNYFINSETITKAINLLGYVNKYNELPPGAENNHIHLNNSFLIIDTNYSGWHLPFNGDFREINYFREDVDLNCYYLGLHLMHPFWMSNNELDEMNPRHAEHFFYAQHQLSVRYTLEKVHLLHINRTDPPDTEYNPFLIYDNGLPFPSRFSNTEFEFGPEATKIRETSLKIRTCIQEGVIYMGAEKIDITGDESVNQMAKLIKSNFDNAKMGKIIRHVNEDIRIRYPIDEYNPAPSVYYHYETSLRHPRYWNVIKFYLDFLKYYREVMTPFNMTDYVLNDINIISGEFPRIETYFEYNLFPIQNAIQEDVGFLSKKWMILARQRRLQHSSFNLNFTVHSDSEKDVVVRLFLGPECNFTDCWERFIEFYELDAFSFHLTQGPNIISWDPEKSKRYSYYVNDVTQHYLYNRDFLYSNIKGKKYDMFKYPGHLLMPRGLEQGLKFKLAIIITPADNVQMNKTEHHNKYYRHILYELDTKPLGFPFYRVSIGHESTAPNYRMFDITIYHRQQSDDDSGRFSSNLY